MEIVKDESEESSEEEEQKEEEDNMDFEVLSENLNKKQLIELTKGTTKPDTRKIIAEIISDYRD
jgi:hypothetical protein